MSQDLQVIVVMIIMMVGLECGSLFQDRFISELQTDLCFRGSKVLQELSGYKYLKILILRKYVCWLNRIF